MSSSIYWGDKRYHSLDFHLKDTYKKKLYKIALNGGMTCPNRDGTIDTRGCIFCSSKGSGDFATSPELDITAQINQGINFLSSKFKLNQKMHRAHANIPSANQYIAYFQAFTNTYGEITYLRRIFFEAINHPSITILSIATRPDCINDEILSLLVELNQIKPVWIELGLQTIHERTANFIRRGYPLSTYDQTMIRLHTHHITTIVHLILGLPGETHSDLMKTIKYVSLSGIHGLKLQLLHKLKDTDLSMYNFPLPTMEEYVHIIADCIEIIPPHIVIHRLTGDAPRELLLEPLWSCNKKLVLNSIQKELKLRNSWQGKNTNFT